MDKNYYELITKAAAESDWNQVVQLGNEARMDIDNPSFVKKGFFNIITMWLWGKPELVEKLENCGIKVFYAPYVADFNKILKNGEINLEILKEKDVVIITQKDGVTNKLAKLNFPIINYSYLTKYDPLKHFKNEFLKNNETKKVYELTSDYFKALNRGSKIDQIFED